MAAKPDMIEERVVDRNWPWSRHVAARVVCMEYPFAVNDLGVLGTLGDIHDVPRRLRAHGRVVTWMPRASNGTILDPLGWEVVCAEHSLGWKPPSVEVDLRHNGL